MIIIGKTCLDLIKSFEALSLKPYHGAADRPNIFTIGYGTIKYPPHYLSGKMVAMTDSPITEAQAIEFLLYEVNHKSYYIDPFLRDDLSENQFAALISFAYNVGEGMAGLRGSTLLKKVNANKQDTSIRDEFMRWVHADGKEVAGLKRRRNDEADLYFTV